MSERDADAPPGGDVRAGGLGPALRWLPAPLALLGLALLWRALPVSDWVEHALIPRIERAGARGYLAFMAVYVLAVVLMAPGTLLTLAGGFLFGPLLGAGLALASATAGASLAFLIARRLAREAVRRRVEADRRFRAIDRAVARRGGRVVLLLRLSPLVPFNVLNYALGLTGVRFSTYALASLVGMAPGTAAIAFVGASAGDRGPESLGWPWWAAIVALALLTAAGLAAIAARALARADDEAEADGPDDPDHPT